MNQLPPELQQALQHQRLLIVWGDLPFELPPRVSAERAVLINKLITEAAKLPAVNIRLSVTPPLPILSLDPTDRIEREFQASGRALRVMKSSQDLPTPARHTLIKLAGDLNSRSDLVLSREEVQQLLGDDDKRYLLDLVRRITAEDSAVILVECDPASVDFQAWWAIIRPAFGSASIFAAGDPATTWPDGVPYLGSVQDVVNAAFANLKAPPPKMDSDLAFEMQAYSAAEKSGLEMADPPTPEPASSKAILPIEVQTLRIDAAVPESVVVGRVFDLAVAVKQLISPLLAVKDLKHVESGAMQTTWEAGTPLINLRLEVDAPDCEIIGKNSIPFRQVRGADSPLFYFRLKPTRAGDLSLVVTVYQEDYWLGSARVNTVAADKSAGQVQIIVSSQSLWLDCEVRLHDRSEAGFKVELTLSGEQTIEGWLSPDAASFIPTGDPRDDGQHLFNLLLADPNLRDAWGEARGRSKQRRLRLRIDARELRALPWELLRDDDDILAAQADTPFSRYLATDQAWGGAITVRPIRVLAVVSNPIDLQTKYDLPPADVSLETAALRGALTGLEQQVQLDVLAAPITLERLEARLRQGYHILQFIGHGAFNHKQNQAALYLQNEDGTAQRVIDADFAGMLRRLSSPPQLIVLAACQSAKQAQTEAFSGFGPKLVQVGVPAVVAMQDNVTVLTAHKFGATFYRRLLEHGTVDLAMNEARSTLIANGRFDAAVPALFMRLRDGRLWGEAPRAAPAIPIEPPPPIGRVALSTEERESLQRQLRSARENLRLIEERKSDYVLEVDVPLQIIKEERRLKDRITELEKKLNTE